MPVRCCARRVLKLERHIGLLGFYSPLVERRDFNSLVSTGNLDTQRHVLLQGSPLRLTRRRIHLNELFAQEARHAKLIRLASPQSWENAISDTPRRPTAQGC